ncbi:MAG: ABC transporter ATP-binding protein [Gammaproteobacteria bacterium]|nr:ABC transporter ATP-binding protein [Gammaproteobacteria bacterium]
MSKLLIQAKNIYRQYGDTLAVNKLSFDLQQGDILGFLGPNGAGKSTTMQMLSGVLAPSAGQILINGIDLLDQPKQAKQHIGYLPEKPPLYTDLTVDEYLAYAARLRNIKSRAIPQAIEQAKQRCNLTSVSKRLIGNLSKGFQQRVGIAQAILHNPDVIILDEPTVGLDPIQIREIRQLIAELGKQHGVILSTHILPEVQAICNKVQIMDHGLLVFSDTLSAMNETSTQGRLLVTFKQPPSIEQLGQLSAVQDVSSLENNRYYLDTDNIERTTDALTIAATENHWQLRELMPEQQTLEHIFVKLVAGQASAPDNHEVQQG